MCTPGVRFRCVGHAPGESGATGAYVDAREVPQYGDRSARRAAPVPLLPPLVRRHLPRLGARLHPRTLPLAQAARASPPQTRASRRHRRSSQRRPPRLLTAQPSTIDVPVFQLSSSCFLAFHIFSMIRLQFRYRML